MASVLDHSILTLDAKSNPTAERTHPLFAIVLTHPFIESAPYDLKKDLSCLLSAPGDMTAIKLTGDCLILH